MRQHRILFVFLLIMILGAALLTGCGTLGAGSTGDDGSGDGGSGAGSAGDDGSGDGGTGDGGSDEGSSNGDESSGDEEDDAFDAIDLSSLGCPEEPTIFAIYLDFQLNVEEDDGYIHERTDPSVGVPLTIHGSEVHYTPNLAAIPVSIDGKSGDCTITGNAQISLQMDGTCENSTVSLDIHGSYDFYQRSILCPGEPSVDAVDSLFPGPSITSDFHLSIHGDTVENSWQGGGGIQYINAWTLRPYTDEEAMDQLEPETSE